MINIMATLYTHKESNIHKTWLLLSVFLVFIILLGWIFSYIFESQAILYFAVLFSILTSIGSYWWSDKIVLAMTKAQPLKEEDNRELFHIVENLCIASGTKMPKIYILPEAQPNAFATGRNEEHAVVAVTVGLLQKLEKTELEGVLAHELSHIKNRDTLLQTIVVILVGIVSLLSNFFLRIGARTRSRDDDSKAGAILLVFSLIVAILAPFAAMFLQLAISRKREFLADASGALLTRYPDGLANALEKIATDATPLRVANNSTAHLFIASPFRGKQKTGWLVKLFMTHPPVEERVAALRGMQV